MPERTPEQKAMLKDLAKQELMRRGVLDPYTGKPPASMRAPTREEAHGAMRAPTREEAAGEIRPVTVQDKISAAQTAPPAERAQIEAEIQQERKARIREAVLAELKRRGIEYKPSQAKREREHGVIRAAGIWDKPGLRPLKRAWDVMQEERKQGQGAMSRAVEDPGVVNTVLGGLGGLQYVFSPVAGVAKGIVGEPVTGALEGAGVNPKLADFVGRTAETATYFAGPGGLVKAGIEKGAGPGFKAAQKVLPASIEELGKAKPTFAIRQAEGAPVSSILPGVLPKVEEGVSKTLRMQKKPLGADVFRTQPAASLLLQPQLRESVVKQVVDATKLSIDATQLDKSKRLFRNIADFLKTGELAVDDIPKIIKAEGISPEQFADIWTETISRAGRELNYLSRLSKDLGVVFKDNKLAASALEKHYNKHKEGQELWERALDGFARMEDFRRGMLVTQLATAMRNMSSQAGRLVLAQFDEALQSTITGGLKAVGLADEATNGINVFNSLYSRLSPRGRTELSRILDSDKAAMHKARMLTQSVHEVPSGTGSLPDTVLSRAAHMGQRLSYVLNTVNRGQEHFFRKIAFEAKLKQRIKDLGKDYRTVDPSEIPEGVYREAVDYALEMTFAASPTSKTGREFLDAYRKLGLTTVNPFPRFAFANALPFVFNHSPLGYLGAMSPKTIKALQSGNPAQFSKAVSRATLGTLMLKSAWHFRQSEYAGEKWYQIKISEDQRTREAKYIDIRAFAPFSSYFFLAEAMLRPERMTNKDYIEAAIGLNRTAGTGLVFVDLLRAKKPETTAKLMENFVGEYVGSFTVPLRTPKDIISHWDKEEATFRDAKNDPTWGPLGRAMTNVPGLGRRFPESASPLSTRERVAETPLLRQFTGLSVTTRNAVEREVDRLGVGWESIYPRTRVEDADRQITRYMAPLMERFGSVLMGHPSYKHASEPRQRIMFKALLKSVRSTATEYYKMKNPDKAGRIWYESLGDDEKKVLGEVLGSNSPLINGLTGRKNN